MKFSRYNFTITLNGSKYLYNSLSNTLITLDDDLQIIMKSLKNNSLQICNFKNKDLLKELIQLQVIVEDDNEEFMYLQYSSNLYRNDFEKIYLSIAPTQDCNFNCTYCYESDRPKIYMNEKIENQIIDYLRSVSPKLMTLVWFGGEPLMAIDTIESLSKKMSVLNIQIEESFIITNGFLLNLNIFKRLLKCGITDLQITLDGSEDEHNQRRPLANGGSTFNTIKNNLLIILDYCTRLNINMKFCIRVNIDQTNKEDFFEVQKIFANYSPNLVTVYPGLKKDHSCRDNTCMKNVEFSDFHLDVFRKTGLRLMDFYPNNVLTECFTRHLTSYLIGANGDMYKCWHDLGNQSKVIGNIDNYDDVNHHLLARYIMGTDPYLDKTCKTCKFMPICGGGCPLERYKNKYEGGNINTCTIFKSRMKELLATHLKIKNDGK